MVRSAKGSASAHTGNRQASPCHGLGAAVCSGGALYGRRIFGIAYPQERQHGCLGRDFATGEAAEAPKRILELTHLFDVARAKALSANDSLGLTFRCAPRRRRGCAAWRVPCAGSTEAPQPEPSQHRDHPRRRGEHGGSARGYRDRLGPSPRARGARHADPPHRGDDRTIPAGAGSTPERRLLQPPCRDHPRGRGEHSCAVKSCRSSPGPSPRARGAPAVLVFRQSHYGTIPAGAGSTHRHRPAEACGADHPRGRGEHKGHSST